MDRDSLKREREFFLYSLIGIFVIKFLFGGIFQISDETAILLTVSAKGVFIYLVYRISSFLKYPTWLTTVYCILSIFALLYLIPVIGLIIGLINAGKNLQDGEVFKQDFNNDTMYVPKLEKYKININYKDQVYIRSLTKWFVYNDKKISDFLEFHGEEKIENLADNIFEELKNIKTQEEFLNVLIKNTACFDVSLRNIGELYKLYEIEFTAKEFEKIPVDDLKRFFEEQYYNSIFAAKSRIVGWIYNNKFQTNYNPDDYREQIEDYINNFNNNFDSDHSEHFNGEFKDYYEILEVSQNASEEVIKKAYKTLVKKYHPDTTELNDKEDAKRRFLEVNEAYDVLKNGESRQNYNIKLREYEKQEHKKNFESKESYQHHTNDLINKDVEKESNQEISAKKNNDNLVIFLVVSFTILLIAIGAAVQSTQDNQEQSEFVTTQNDANLDTREYFSNESSNNIIYIYGKKAEIVQKGDLGYPVILEEGYKDLVEDLNENEILFAEIDINALNFREDYNTSSKRVLALGYKEIFWVLGEKNGWYLGLYIKDNDESFGWASKKYVNLMKYNTETEKTAIIKESTYMDEHQKLNMVNTKKANDTVQQKNVSSSSFFTLGSSKDEVKSIMGTPESIIGDTWGYGISNIYFRNGKVTGWSDIDDNLKVNIGSKDPNAAPITIGSSREDVINAMGTPGSITGDTWGYGISNIYFRNGKVTGWFDIDNNLKVNIGSKDPNAAPITIGSSREDVINAMGTPKSIIGDTWGYGISNIYFRNGKVTGWSDIDGNLKTE